MPLNKVFVQKSNILHNDPQGWSTCMFTCGSPVPHTRRTSPLGRQLLWQEAWPWCVRCPILPPPSPTPAPWPWHRRYAEGSSLLLFFFSISQIGAHLSGPSCETNPIEIQWIFNPMSEFLFGFHQHEILSKPLIKVNRHRMREMNPVSHRIISWPKRAAGVTTPCIWARLQTTPPRCRPSPARLSPWRCTWTTRSPPSRWTTYLSGWR